MTISIEFKDGFYYWTLKDETGISHNWATSLGGVFEQIIEDRVKTELRKYHDRN
jgi:hypothetical protein